MAEVKKTLVLKNAATSDRYKNPKPFGKIRSNAVKKFQQEDELPLEIKKKDGVASKDSA